MITLTLGDGATLPSIGLCFLNPGYLVAINGVDAIIESIGKYDIGYRDWSDKTEAAVGDIKSIHIDDIASIHIY